jgi:hypothetical protein
MHWRENRVREEIDKQDLKQIDTSAHETGLPKSNGQPSRHPTNLQSRNKY